VSASLLPSNIAAAAGPVQKADTISASGPQATFWGLKGTFENTEPVGIYEMSTDFTTSELKLETDSNENTYSAGWIENGVYYVFYGMTENAQKLIAYNPVTWTRIDALCRSFNVPYEVDGMAYDKRDGKLYGQFSGSNKAYFGWIDLSDGSYENVKEWGRDWVSHSPFFGQDGTLYVLADDHIYSVDKATGDLSDVFQIDNYCYYSTSPFYSKQTGKYYQPNVLDFFSIDMEEQKSESMSGFSECYVTGAVEKPYYVGGVPAMPTVTAVTFGHESRIGSIEFTLPQANYDGTEASGDLQYTIYQNGKIIASQQSTYGASINLPISVDDNGKYIFNVTATNSVGEGPMSVDFAYIGVEPPKAPQNVSAAWTNGKSTISWDAVTTGTYGGTIDLDEITYTVTRQPDNVVVANKIAGTSAVDELSEPEKLTTYYYVVTANYKGYSNETQSNLVILGAIKAPYSNTFDSDEDIEAFTIIDANNDGNTWYRDKESNYMSADPTSRWSGNNNDNDDWLITPPVSMQAGKIYQIEYDLTNFSSYSSAKYEVRIGTGNTVDAMTTALLEETEVLYKEGEKTTHYNSPKADEKAYIGWHCTTKNDEGYLKIDNLSIVEFDAAAPGEVSDFAATPDALGADSATITFKAPSKNFMGDGDITELTKIEIARGETIVKTINSPKVGEAISYTDYVEADSVYTYTVTPYNSHGMGRSSSKTIFIGINKPTSITNLAVNATDKVGEVKISWDAPQVDENGYAVSSTLLKYKVYRESHNTSTAEASESLIVDTSENSYTYQAVAEGSQEDCTYRVVAYTAKGESKGVESNTVMIGTPHTMPYRENFSDKGFPTNIYGIRAVEGYSYWNTVDDNDDATGDGGSLRSMSWNFNGETMYYTGQIAITGDNPMLTFFTYYFSSISNNTFTVCVSEDNGNTFSDVQKFVFGDLCKYTSEWNLLHCDMSAYKGKNVVVGIKAYMPNTSCFLDGITLRDAIDYDAMLGTISLPDSTYTESQFEIKVKARNVGEKAISNMNVQLYRDGDVVDSQTISLDVDEMATLTFKQDINVTEETKFTYYAVARYDMDQYTENNSTRAVEMTLAPEAGVGSISADALRISAANRAIVVANAEGQDILVTGIDGKVIAHEIGSSETRFNVIPGLYIVRVGKQVAKLIVK
jgi:hypothetical protein